MLVDDDPDRVWRKQFPNPVLEALKEARWDETKDKAYSRIIVTASKPMLFDEDTRKEFAQAVAGLLADQGYAPILDFQKIKSPPETESKESDSPLYVFTFQLSHSIPIHNVKRALDLVKVLGDAPVNLETNRSFMHNL